VEPKLALVQVELPLEAFAEDWQPTPDDHMGIVRWIHLYSLRAILLPVMELTVQPEWNQLIIDAKRESRFCSYFPLPFVHVPISVPLALHWEFMLIDQQLLAFMCWKRFLLCYMLPKNLSAHPLMDMTWQAQPQDVHDLHFGFHVSVSEDTPKDNSYSHFSKSCSYQSTRNGHAEDTSSSGTHHNRRRLCVGVVWLCI